MAGLQKAKKKVAFMLLFSMLVVMTGLPAIAEGIAEAAETTVVHTDVAASKIGEGDTLTINSWLSKIPEGTTDDIIKPVIISGKYANKVKMTGLSADNMPVVDDAGETAYSYNIEYPVNGRQITFLVALDDDMPTGLKSGQELARISIGGTDDVKAVITLYYSTLKTVEKIETSFSDIRLTKNKTQEVSAWLSPKPVTDNEFCTVTVNGNYAEYITVESDQIRPDVNGVQNLYFKANGAPSTLKIGLKENLPDQDLTDGYVLAEVVLGSTTCQPTIIYVRYAKNERYLSEIVFLERKLKLEVGQTYQMEPVLKPKTATNTELNWSLENNNAEGDDKTVPVAKIDNGLITALEPGTVTVTATAVKPDDPDAKRASASIELTVYRAAGSEGYDVKVEPENPDVWNWNDATHQLLLVKGQQKLDLQLISKDTGITPSEPIRWKSTRSKVVLFLSEDKNGKETQVNSVTTTSDNQKVELFIKEPGETAITATGVNSGERFSFNIKASVQPVNEIKIYYQDYYTTDTEIWQELPQIDGTGEETPLKLAMDRRLQLKTELTPEDTTDRKVTWKTEDVHVAKVDRNNVLIATGIGITTITAQVKQTIVEGATELPDGTTPENPGDTVAEVDPDAPDANENNKKEKYTILEKKFTVIVGEGSNMDTITVTPCDENGVALPPPVITAVDGIFTNTRGEGNPYSLGAGRTAYFLVENNLVDLGKNTKIKWKASRSGYITMKQKTLDTGNVLLSVKGTTSTGKLKNNDIVRLVATNVGDFPGDMSDPDFPSGNYPEIFFKIEAAAPESIEIKNVPKFLEIGRSRELGIIVKPKRSDERVTWSVSDESIAKIDATTGVLEGIKPGFVTVKAVAQKAVEGKAPATAEVTIPVGYKVSSAKLNATSIKLAKGETFQLLLSVLPYQAEENDITFVAQADHIAYVDANGLIQLYDTAQPGEKTTIFVYIGDPENPLKKLKCKVQVVKDMTQDPSPEELAQVVVTTKTPEATLLPGSNKKLTYVINGLTSAQKNRVEIKWELVNETSVPTVSGNEVLTVDKLGVVSVLENPQANQAQVKATFWYVPHTGDKVQLTTTDEPDNTALLYTININPSLVVKIDNDDPVSKPDTIYVDDAFPTDGITLEAMLTPPDGEAAMEWTPNKTFEKYLIMEPVGDNPNRQKITLIGERPEKAVTVSLKIKNTEIKKTITVKFKIYPEEQ